MDISLNSTATNLWSTLLSVGAGFVLAQLGLAAKAWLDRRRLMMISAQAALADLVQTQVSFNSWRRLLAPVPVGSIGPVEAPPPLVMGGLELAVTNGSFALQHRDLLNKAIELMWHMRQLNANLQFREQYRFLGSEMKNYGAIRQEQDERILKILEDIAPDINRMARHLEALSQGKSRKGLHGYNDPNRLRFMRARTKVYLWLHRLPWPAPIRRWLEKVTKIQVMR